MLRERRVTWPWYVDSGTLTARTDSGQRAAGYLVMVYILCWILLPPTSCILVVRFGVRRRKPRNGLGGLCISNVIFGHESRIHEHDPSFLITYAVMPSYRFIARPDRGAVRAASFTNANVRGRPA